MREYIGKLCTVLLVVVVFVNAEVSVENGGYSVVVSFKQNVPPENAEGLLNDMKDSLKDASEILQNAIGLKFSKVTFKIPTSWDTSGWNITVEEHPSNFNSPKNDFLIDNATDVVFGKQPFAHQYGGCGTPGRQITIPTDFFSEANTFPKGTYLAREWLKYRYGVFEENGYFGDRLYPLYYVTPGSDPNDVKVTECTDVEVEYKLVGQDDKNCSESDKTVIERLDSKDCKLKPDVEVLNISSSMMYFQEDIHSMKHICGKDSDHIHNSRSPNKHNVLCQGQSIWDVVKKSSDFQEEIKKETNAEGFEDIEYVYIHEAKPKIVVAWENTANIINKGTVLLNAIQQLLLDIPGGSKFNGFPFTKSIPEASERDYKLHDVSEILVDRSEVLKHISSDFMRGEDANINAALSKALDILLDETSGSGVEGTIIIISWNSMKVDETLLQRLKDSKACIKFMYFGEKLEGTVPEAMGNYASASPCGSVTEFSMEDKDEDVFRTLLEAMETNLPATVGDKTTETVKIEYLKNVKAMNVEVDDLVETVTFWIFDKKEMANFHLEFNGAEKPLKGNQIQDVLYLSYSPPEAGKIDLSFPHNTTPVNMLTRVTVTSKEGKYFNGDVLIHDTSDEGSTDQMPIIIYAFIHFGAYPVQNAIVTATVERPNAKNVELELYDNGRGDPDITQNDGIYSRYFTQFSEKGEYTVTVTVKSNGQVTTFGADKNTGYQSCCGSYVNGETSKLSEFSKEFKTTFAAKNGRPEDGYKPSRILDLRVDSLTDDKITLKWTAPGEEADFGTAQSYEIKCFASQDEAKNNFDNGMSVCNYSVSPKEVGETEILEVNFSDFEKSGLYYIVIKTKNSNKSSDVSNTIEIFISDDKTITEEPDKEDKTSKGSVNSKTVGIIIGIIVAVIILVIIIYMGIYFLVLKPKRKKEAKQKSDTHPPKGNENHVLNPINFVSAATLIEHHNEKARAKMENKEPPIFKEEDFEEKKSAPTNESGESSSNNDQQEDKTDTLPRNNESRPPKSPKRITRV